MAEDYIQQREFEQYQKRREEEDKRQNERLAALEKRDGQINTLALSVQELASSVKSSVKEMERLSKTVEQNVQSLDNRLSKIEDRDGDKWRNLIWYLLTAVIGVVIGLVFKTIGLV